MPNIESASISGVLLVHLEPRTDERGLLLESFRQEWFPGASPMVQGVRSDSKRGVVRALHYHRHQADYWNVPRGRIFVALFDLRRSSPTRHTSLTVEIGEGAEIGVYIPPGIAHGFQAVTDATLTYLVDQYYDASDEYGLAWDDPTAAIPWPIAEAILSDRDRANPKLDEIPDEAIPS